MKLYGATVLLTLGILAQVRANRITLDENAQELCKKYKMMCKTGKVCAVQHFDWPKNVTIPVCIPLSYVPVRNMFCQLPPDVGRCHARYIRWYFNANAQECTHFQYGGCEGNQNNFMSKTDCEQACMATPAIKLYENGYSALLQPSIVSAPVYEPQNSNSYEALNSVIEPEPRYDYQLTRRNTRPTKTEPNNSRTRRRLEKEKEKEKERKRKDRERRRELKRLRRQRKKEQKKQKKREQRLKEKKDKKKKNSVDALSKLMEEDDNEMMRDNTENENSEIVRQTKDMVTNSDEAKRERVRNEKRRERKRLKRRERRKRKLEKERKKKERLAKITNSEEVSDLANNPDNSVSSKMLAALDQGKSVKSKKNTGVPSTT